MIIAPSRLATAALVADTIFVRIIRSHKEVNDLSDRSKTWRVPSCACITTSTSICAASFCRNRVEKIGGYICAHCGRQRDVYLNIFIELHKGNLSQHSSNGK